MGRALFYSATKYRTADVMGAGGRIRRPHDPCEPNVGFEIMDCVAVGYFLRGRRDVRKKKLLAGCGHVGVRHTDKLRENLWCSGDRPPGHAAYAPLAYWRPLRYYERRKRSLIFCMRTKSGLPLDKNGFIVILNTEVA